MAQYLLKPRTVRETPAGWDRLFIRVGIHRGVSIIERLDGTFYEARYPAQTELEEAKRSWIGGHEYVIDQATRDVLVAAGFGDCITDYYPPGSYGYGTYGAGVYGDSREKAKP